MMDFDFATWWAQAPPEHRTLMFMCIMLMCAGLGGGLAHLLFWLDPGTLSDDDDNNSEEPS